MKREIPTAAKYKMIESYNETVYVCNYLFHESCWLTSAFIPSNDSFWPWIALYFKATQLESMEYLDTKKKTLAHKTLGKIYDQQRSNMVSNCKPS